MKVGTQKILFYLFVFAFVILCLEVFWKRFSCHKLPKKELRQKSNLTKIV